MKKFLCCALITCSIFSMQLKDSIIYPKALIPEQLGNIKLYHHNNEFIIVKESQKFPIQPVFMDKTLRGITTEQLSQLFAANAYLKVNQTDMGEYTLRLNGRLV